MRHQFTIKVLALVAIWISAGPGWLMEPAYAADRVELANFDPVDDRRRGQVVLVTPSVIPQEPLPLVILLHGYGMNQKQVDEGGWVAGFRFRGLRLLDRVDEHQFILARPNGTRTPVGPRHWNVFSQSGAVTATDTPQSGTVDDVDYILGLIDLADALPHVAVDRDRVILVGHSNGGFMAHLIACRAGHQIAAVVSLAGTTLWDASACRAEARQEAMRSLHILHIHGTSDPIVSYSGGLFRLSADEATATYPGALETVTIWAELLAECEGPVKRQDHRTHRLNLIRETRFNQNDQETIAIEAACSRGSSATLWRM